MYHLEVQTQIKHKTQISWTAEQMLYYLIIAWRKEGLK